MTAATAASRAGRPQKMIFAVIVFGLALLLAVLSALLTGRYAASRLGSTEPTVRGRLGQTVPVEGTDYRLDALTVAGSFPAEDKDDPAVRGPSGSVIVLALITQTVVDHRAPLDDQYCDVSLHSGDQTWRPDSDVTYAMRRPDELGCGGSSDHPLRYDRPQQFGVTFVIPSEAAAQLSVWISLRDGADVIGFSV